jgi:hypothetical protein
MTKAPEYDGDGRRELTAADRATLAAAARLDRGNPGAGAVLRLRVAAAMQREIAAHQAEQRTQTQP